MTEKEKKIAKIACKIYDQYVEIYKNINRVSMTWLNSLECRIQDLSSTRHQLKKYYNRLTDNMFSKRMYTLKNDLSSMKYKYNEIEKTRRAASGTKPSPLDIYRELLWLEKRDENFFKPLKEGLLKVRTKRIVLDDGEDYMDFGEFEIVIPWKNLHQISDNATGYWLIALQPNESSNGNVHPHMSTGGEPCEGDAYLPRRGAMLEGRFADFFDIMTNYLNTYNANGAYQRIDTWNGEECYGCEETVDEDDLYYCEECQHSFCGECSTYCRECDDTVCDNCYETCGTCDCSYHKDCMITCDCDTYVCKSCKEECSICGEIMCPQCRFTCSECEAKICEGCVDGNLCTECKENQDVTV